MRIAINGCGRIGRMALRAIFENYPDIDIVAVNDLSPIETSAHLIAFDSVHGRFPGKIDTDGNNLIINGKTIPYFQQKDPSLLPFWQYQVDCVIESTGFFVTRDGLQKHLDAGAQRVILSAPANTAQDVDKTIVFGVNEDSLTANDTIVSNASCTTNCLTPIVDVLNKKFGIISGYCETVHAFTADQKLVDSAHSDLSRARAASLSMVPSKTGAAKAVAMVLPEMAGKLDGSAVRVPTADVSRINFNFITSANVTKEDINAALIEAAQGNRLKGILGINTKPLVSVDFVHTAEAANVNIAETRAIPVPGFGTQVIVTAWYDNEWGYTHQLLRTMKAMMPPSSSHTPTHTPSQDTPKP